MAAIPFIRHAPLIRAVVAFGVVFVLLRSAQSVDVLSGLTKPLVVGLLELFGVRAVDEGDQLWVAGVRVPWTGDCAGLNILAVLLALTFWANRSEPFNGKYLVKVAAAVPLAFLANIGRIVTLIAYRVLLFPAVESPQLHYFVGFAWLLPFVGLFLPRRKPGEASRLPGVLQTAAALGLVAPHVGGPGGALVTMCVLLALAHSRFSAPRTRSDYLLTGAWVVAAPLIAIARMESLWLPWLLACPIFLPRSRRLALTLPLVLLGTIPLAAAHEVLRWIIGAGIVSAVWLWLAPPAEDTAPAARPERFEWFGALVLGAYLIFPFVATSFPNNRAIREIPPRGAMTRLIEARAFEVRIAGQSRDVGLAWYEPSGGGRHHTLEVCMRYRGVTLRPSEHAGVWTDGKTWMREFFLLGDDLIPDYRSYVSRTFLPFSQAGVHLIVVGAKTGGSAEAFAAETDVLARQLVGLRAAERRE
jgi:exosortase/archaeosortase family protein